MKKVGYLIFACFYYIFRIFRIKQNKVFCIMTHDGSEDSSVGVVVSYLKAKSGEHEFHYLRKEDKKNKLSFFVVKPYHLATSACVLQDNIFLPLSYIRFSRKVKVIQLWHGTGTIKKFGQSVNTGQLKDLEKRANQTITHLIVNSEYTKQLYQETFGIDESRVYLLGLPRTDVMFDEEKKVSGLNRFYKEDYPSLKGKKILLYAPTFRDSETDCPQIRLDIPKLLDNVSNEYVLLLRLHPFVASSFQLEAMQTSYGDRVINVSSYDNLNTLLFASDILITDYSSIIFEYSLLEKPMVFYAYDLEEFSQNGRGFYKNYKEYVPGPIAESTEDLIQIINEDKFNFDRISKFKGDSYYYLDGKSTERLYQKVLKKL